jgi:hypothetical protein
MSDATRNAVDLQAILGQIVRNLAESGKLQAETNKLVVEQRKLMAEAQKLDRDRRLAPMVVVTSMVVSLLGGALGLATFIASRFH